MKKLVVVGCAAVAAALAEGASVSVTVANATGEATLSTDGETWQSSVTVDVQAGEYAQVYDKAGFVRLVPAVAGTYYALSNCTGMATDPTARTTVRPDGATAVIFENAKTSTFLPGGSWLVPEMLVVGGGGAGGNTMGGGGGGGGVAHSDEYFAVTEADSFTMTVGAGGTKGGTSQQAGTAGGASSLSLNGTVRMSVLGGGGGGGWGDPTGKSGGSGGGGCNTSAGGTGTSGQGFDGAQGLGDSKSGGGGGAGGPGQQADAATTTAGRGGLGFACTITGTAKAYGAGGGGGGSNQSNFKSYFAGAGGGDGAGSGGRTTAGAAGLAGTGGGGGGGGWTGSNQYGGAGGSGTVVLVLMDTDPGVIVTGEPEALGADGVPEYGKYEMSAGDARTFTAPPFVMLGDAGTERMLCSGYRLDTLDLNTTQWMLGGETNELLSCTYVQDGASLKRIAWIWRKQVLMSITNMSGGAVLSLDGGTTWFAGTNAWADVGSELVVTARASSGYVAWGAVPASTIFADDGLSATFDSAQPMTVRVDVFTPTHVWTGDVSTEFELATNWKSAEGEIVDEAPGVESTVFIPREVAQQPVVSSPFTVKNLYIGALTNVTGTVKLTFENGVTTNIVSGNVRLLYGARMSHTSKYATSGSGTAWEKTYTVQRRLSLFVGGDMTIDEGAAIDATGCGYSSNAGPGSGDEYIVGGSYGGHGQRKTVYPACYGSIRAPLDYGSGGQWGTGGGSINLVVAGDLTVNGAIRSNGQAVSERGAAGGSVFLTVGTLLGEGFIEANGSLCSYGGAGGRISIVEKIAKVSQFTKNISCIGSESGGASASGTIYRENASDESGRGTLIVPGQNTANTTYQTELAASRMPDANEPFGAIFVEKNAGLRLFAGTTCTVTRVLSVVTGNGASFTADVGSCLKFVGAGDACVTGALTFAGLECTEPGKRIVFTPGTAGKTSIKAGGLLTVRGTEESPVELWGVDGAEWLLNLDASAETDILHASVTNSNASSGSSLLAISSNDLGGNQKWSFKDPILPGEVNEWTGTVSSDWSDEKNWSLARLPLDTDDVRILDPDAPYFPVMTVANTRWNKLTVGEGTTLTLSGSTIDVTNELTVAGTLVFSGRQNLSITAPTASFAGATVVPAESTVRILDGVDTFDPGDCTFCRVEILRAGGSLVLTDGLKARSFEVRATDDVTLTFAVGKTIEADTIVCSCRAADKYLTLQSSAADEKWFLKSPRISYMTGVRVSDSTASDAKAVASLSVNVRESNTNWVFDNGVSEWVGGASGKFDVAANWYPAGVPGATNDVILRGAAEITADGNVSVRTLTLLPDEVKGSLTVKGVLTTVGDTVIGTNATLTLSTVTEFNEIGKDLVVQAGGTVTHPALSSTANTLADSRNGAKLFVRAKNILVEKGGTISAVGKGFPIVKGPAALGSRSDASGAKYNMGAGHAGMVNHSRSGAATTSVYPVLTDYRAYGSMFEPMAHGSGGNESTPGGGVIRLVVSGDITLDGTISAAGKDGYNYGHSGAGGSVWITVDGALKGAATGLISAAGGKGLHQNAAGGGRIAVYAGVSSFSGRLSASGKKASTSGVMTQAPGTVLTKFGDEEIYSLVLDYDEYTSALSGYGSDGNLAMLATDIPTEEDLDKLELFKRTSITCGHLTVLNLTRDLKLYDLNFTEAAGSKARLNLHTLKLLSSAHKKGKGWAVKNAGDDPIATHIWPCEKDGAKGKVVWAAGMALIVR